MLTNPLILSAALEGLEIRLQKLEALIRELKGQGAAKAPKAPAAEKAAVPKKAKAKKGKAKKAAGPKRVMSPEARARIAAAQKKRWAAVRKAKA